MKIIIFIALSYLLCRFIKPKWKAFLVGIVGYLIISYITLEIFIPAGTRLNVTASTVSNFGGKALGEFTGYFLLGLAGVAIFNRSKKAGDETIESSSSNDTKDIASN